jgi:glycerol-3-phosphate dehydrogenase
LIKTEVVVIGGGATGAGVLRDLALRGIEAVLLEMGELTGGTSGRNHGLLHSGARYAVNDPDSGRECISENRILKKIAGPCIEDTGGFFLSLPEDPPAYADQFFASCERIGIPAREIPAGQVLEKEPALTGNILRAFSVPDAAVDPFRLIRANVEEAENLGAAFFPYREVFGISSDRGSIRGLTARDPRTGEEFSIECRCIVNAAGVWAGKIAQMAGGALDILFSKGSLLVLSRRLVNSVINRCRPPGSGDIFVPHGPALILGTTSRTVKELGEPTVDEDEVDLLLSEAERMIPQAGYARAIRAYAGVRPLMGAREGEEDSRKISRDFLLVNHGETDGVKGLFSIIGGKLTTYRFMAERAVDAVCAHLEKKASCTTAERPLPFPEGYSFRNLEHRLEQISRGTGEMVCECELVPREEILREIDRLPHSTMIEVQQRTRAGMGPCQGGFCAHRVIALLSERGKIPPGTSLSMLKRFLEERWKGIRPVLWGAQLREEQLIQALYSESFNLEHDPNMRELPEGCISRWE